MSCLEANGLEYIKIVTGYGQDDRCSYAGGHNGWRVNLVLSMSRMRGAIPPLSHTSSIFLFYMGMKLGIPV